MKYRLEQLFLEKEVKGLCFDSRRVKAGDAFFAIKGTNLNGNNFIEQALQAGARVVISDDRNLLDDRIIYVDDVAEALSYAADIFYPLYPKNLIAVTGTNGKTSIVSYVRQLFSLLDVASASIGTLGVEISSSNQLVADQDFNTALTTPDVITLHKIFNYLAANDIQHVAFEASSHALVQKRLHEIAVNAAAFSSFSQDHLDYHSTMEEYLAAKLKLFTENLVAKGVAIFNSAIPGLDLIKDDLVKKDIELLTIGLEGDIKVTKSFSDINGQVIEFVYRGKNYGFKTEIIGSFQGINLLIAAMLVHKSGFVFSDVIDKLSQVRAISGRLEKVTAKSHHFQVFVDYAHTPDALGNSLTELRKLLVNSGRLLLVFGCGGNRDKSKRFLMGEIAGRLADLVIITDDNPRNEDPSAIRSEIMKALPEAIEISDRNQAIKIAISHLKDGDILLVAGKGHEKYQIIGSNIIEMDDVEIARFCLEKYKI